MLSDLQRQKTLVVKGNRSLSNILIWRDKLQEKFNKIEGNGYFHFTCDTCNPDGRQSRN